MLKRCIRWKHLVTPVICCILVAVLAVTFNYELLFAARAAYDSHAREAETQNQIYGHGEIINGVNEIRFIQAGGFESATVTLVYEADPSIKYPIPYGVPVQTLLEEENAPSGRYKIIEANAFGDVIEYYGIYIRVGDNRTEIETTRVNGAIRTNQPLSKENAGATFTVNSFIIKSASNELDPYGIVKVSNRAGEMRIYQLDEVDNVVIDRQGEWTVTLVDRLGNSVNFFVNIYTPSEIHRLTLVDNGVEYSTKPVAGGERVYLDVLASTDQNYVFIGWADGQGNIYNGQFLFGFTSDMTLTAVWHYTATTVSVYDGGLIASYQTKAGERIGFPTSLRKEGY